MLPSLQPSRPKAPQHNHHQSYAHQQTRAFNENDAPHPITASHQSSAFKQAAALNNTRPRSQIEAMPPFGPTQHSLMPPRGLYDSSVRHPVFFTEGLRRPPFPIPEMASHGWNPVANGYIMEQKKAEASGITKTKL